MLYTDALVQRAGIDSQAQGLIAHRETIDIIGEVNCWVGELNASWKAKQERRRIEVSPADAIATWTIDVAAARATTWEYLTTPSHPAVWTAGSTGVDEDVVNGCHGAGTGCGSPSRRKKIWTVRRPGAPARAIDAHFGRNAGETARRSSSSATRRGEHRAGSACFRRRFVTQPMR